MASRLMISSLLQRPSVSTSHVVCGGRKWNSKIVSTALGVRKGNQNRLAQQGKRTSSTHSCPVTSSSGTHTCPVTSSRHKSSAVSFNAVFEDAIKPFDAIPIPGGYDKGLLGVIAPLFHAWRHGAFTQPHEYQSFTSNQLGSIYRTRVSDGSWMVVLSDPDLIETALRRVGKYPRRPSIQAWIDYKHDNKMSLGLLTSDGEEWQRLRSAVSQGILRPNVVAKHVGNMHDIVLEFIDKVKSSRRQDGVIPDIEEELYKWAMESSARFVFDRKLNLIKPEVLKPENQAFFDALRVLTFKSFEMLAVPQFILNLFPPNRNPTNLTNKAWADIHNLAKSYMDEKMSSLARKAVRSEDIDDGTFVAFLMLQDKLTPGEIYSSVSEILAASVDTTSYTSTWGIHLLSKNPNVQEKLFEEVTRVIPAGTTPSREQIDSMPYLKAVVKETQRFFPITIGTARILEEDIILGDYHIPKGTHIQTNFYSAGRKADVFDDPEEFRPERWLDPNRKYHPFASMPFGHGTRMCVGRRIAEQEMYLLLAEVVRNFKIEATKPDVDSLCGIIINPESSIEPKFIDRSN